jgi:hypothetical protein
MNKVIKFLGVTFLFGLIVLGVFIVSDILEVILHSPHDTRLTVEGYTLGFIAATMWKHFYP